jgi:hypothetical protein
MRVQALVYHWATSLEKLGRRWIPMLALINGPPVICDNALMTLLRARDSTRVVCMTATTSSPSRS